MLSQGGKCSLIELIIVVQKGEIKWGGGNIGEWYEQGVWWGFSAHGCQCANVGVKLVGECLLGSVGFPNNGGLSHGPQSWGPRGCLRI